MLRAVVRDCMVTDKAERLANFDVVSERLAAALPELERSKLLLPSPARQIGEPLSDPDATNALPLLRGSSAERHISSAPPPPTSSPNVSGPRSGNGPASGFSKPTTPTSTRVAEAISHPRAAYMAGAVVVGLAAAAGIVGVVRAAGGSPHSLPSAHVDPTPVAAAADPPPRCHRRRAGDRVSTPCRSRRAPSLLMARGASSSALPRGGGTISVTG